MPNPITTPPTEPAAETPPPANPAPAASEPARLPDDHPLVKAFTTQKAELAQLKQQRADAENATKSEAQKLADRISELEKDNAALALEKLRAKVASEKSDPEKGLNVPADLLSGSTEAELVASADKLIPHLAKGTPQLPGNQRPAGPVSQVQGREETREDRRKRLEAELKR